MTSVIKLSKRRSGLDPREVYIVDPRMVAEELRTGADGEMEPPAEDEASEPEVDPRDLARREAGEIVRAAEAEADAIRAQAYEQGLEEGRSAGAAEWLASIEDAAEAADRMNAELDEFFKSIEPQVVKLSAEIAEKIVRRELSSSPEIIVDIVRAGLRQLRDKENVKVRVNPADVEVVREHRPELMEAFDGIRNIEIVDDRRVDRGGCMIDAPGGVLDARIRTQVNEIERKLTEAATENAGIGDAGAGQVQPDP